MVLKKIKDTPFKDTVNNLLRKVPRVPLNSLATGDFFMSLCDNTGEFKFFKFCENKGNDTQQSVELAYDEARGVQIFQGCQLLRNQLVWKVPELVKSNIQELQVMLENYSQNDPNTVLAIRDLLDTLGWEYSLGMDCVTADAFIIYREDSAPNNATGKNTPLSVLADPQLLRDTLRFLQKTFSETVQERMGN